MAVLSGGDRPEERPENPLSAALKEPLSREDLEERMRLLREANQQLNAKVSELSRQRQQVTDAKEQLQNRLAVLTGVERPSEEPATEYDAVCHLRSLAEVVASGRVECWRSASSVFDMAQERRCRIVAVVGLYDKGKTFLINKLFGLHLRSGKLISTQGLSFIFFEQQRILLVDTAGIQAPVMFRTQQSRNVQPMFDAHSTESLLFEMIPRLAHHLIFVVNDLTWAEQDHIAKLNHKFAQGDQHKELIVVHNMRTTVSPTEAEELFRRQISQLYDGEFSHLASLVYVSDFGGGLPSVHHVGICEDHSLAGERYNHANIQLLVDMLEHRQSLGQLVNLSQLLQQELQRLLPLFITVEPAAGGSEAQQLSVSFAKSEKPVVRDGFVQLGEFEVRPRLPEQRLLIKHGDGRAVVEHDRSFRPQINVFDQRSDGVSEQRIIQIECPGVNPGHVTIISRPTGVKIAILKNALIDESVVTPVGDVQQTHGFFEKEFVFGQDRGRYELCDQHGWYLEAGVLTVVLVLKIDQTIGMAKRRPQLVSSS